jgi:uncharacterized protein (TIGR02271 family)
VDIDERVAQFGYTANRATPNETTTSIPIIEEELQVGKRVVETGGVRLRSRIIERLVEEQLRLREERVYVERQAVDRPATEADFTQFGQGAIEMREQAEVPIVNKEARVVEEVSLSKEVEEREEIIRDTIRKTEVDVEEINKPITRDSLIDRGSEDEELGNWPASK